MTSRRTLRLVLAALCVAALPLVSAAAVDVEVSVTPKEVPANGQVRVDIVVSGPDAGNAVLESTPQGVRMIPRGGISSSSSFQMVNGVMSSSKTFTLRYVPSGVGEGEIPSFVVLAGGTQTATDPVKVTITEAVDSPPIPGRSDDEPTTDIEVLILADVDRPRLYQGESLNLQYRLLFRNRVTGLLSPQGLEPVPGFVTRDFEVDRQIRRTRHDDKPWQEVVLFKRRLTPTRAGSIRIEPVVFTVEVEDPRSRSSFFSLRRSVAVERTARGIDVEVRPLPEDGRPADFSGGVGGFTLSAGLDRTELAAGDAAALTVTLESDAPLGSITPPAVPEVSDLRVFEPEVEDGRRRRTWRYPLVPQSAGEITLPPIRFSYFDPKAETYRTLESAPLTLQVAPGDIAVLQPGTTSPGRRIRALASDLRFIKPAPGLLVDRRGDHYRQAWFWMLVGIPVAAVPAVALVAWRRERLDRTGRTRERRAARHARRRIKQARAALGRSDGTAEAQRQAAEALAGYVADRAHRSEPGMTYDALVGLALKGGASDECARALRETVEGFDRQRYTPGGGSAEETGRLLEQADAVITRLEKEWR